MCLYVELLLYVVNAQRKSMSGFMYVFMHGVLHKLGKVHPFGWYILQYILLLFFWYVSHSIVFLMVIYT